MDSQALWFRVIPAAICILIGPVLLVLFARYVPKLVRTRDWRGLATLAFTYMIVGCYLFLAVIAIMHPTPD